MNKNRRPQSHKTENKAYIGAMRDLRRSNAAQPHRNKAKYRRADSRNDFQRGKYED